MDVVNNLRSLPDKKIRVLRMLNTSSYIILCCERSYLLDTVVNAFSAWQIVVLGLKGRGAMGAKRAAICAAMLVVGGCAQSLKPLGQESFNQDVCKNKTKGLEISICQMDAKSVEISDAYFKWYNEPAVFDAPVLGLAVAAAGLLLFDAHTDAIKAVTLGAGGLVAGREYLNTRAVRSALLDGADGYSCLADAGRITQTFESDVNGRKAASNQLALSIAGVENNLKDPKVKFDNPERANRAVTDAKAALALYKAQATALGTADAKLRQAGRDISVGLLRRIERQVIDFAQVFQSLSNQAAAQAKFKPGTSGAGSVGPQVVAAPARRTPDQAVADLEIQSANLVAGLPNAEAQIAEFGVCAARSITGAKSAG